MSKKIAIIGGGFSGLGLCAHLIKLGNPNVTIFDPKEIGQGVSGIASGLLHPFPGEHARPSWQGKKALQLAKELLKDASDALGEKVTREEGILRLALNENQEKMFRERASNEDDIEWWDAKQCHEKVPGSHFYPGIFIRSGVCVDAKQYLLGLWKFCEGEGARWIHEKADPKLLTGYDQVAIAAGAGILKLKECESLRVNTNKGQLLVCEKPHYFNPGFSLIGKGYLAMGKETDKCTLGSTYEREFLTEKPCLGVATEKIFSQIGQFLPSYSSFNVLGCLSGVRVNSQKGYHPIVGRLKDDMWVMTAMGSRGLLYHSFLGQKLAQALLADDDQLLPEEVRA